MIISLSAAAHFYWLARYAVRAQTIIDARPWQDARSSQQFADAFGLEQTEPEALKRILMDSNEPGSFMSVLANIHDNIQSVRGIISQDIFEAFNLIWRQKDDYEFVAGAFAPALETMQTLPDNAGLFWKLGLLLEQFDVALRMGESTGNILAQLESLIEQLPACWTKLRDDMVNLLGDPGWGTFYMLTFSLHDALERGV